MHRFRPAAQSMAVVFLLGLLLAACRVAEISTTAYPESDSYPAPVSREPVATSTTVPIQKPTSPRPPASPVPTAASTVSEVAFTVTILHTGEVAGEVAPCG